MLTVFDICNNYLTDTLEIKVFNMPIISLPETIKSGCIPLSVQFKNLQPIDSGAIYSWDFGDGILSAVAAPTHTYSTPGTYDVTLSVSNQGCKKTSAKASKVHVFNLPDVDFAANPNEAYIDNAVIQFSISNSSATYSYIVWHFGDEDSATSITNPIHTYRDIGKYNIMLAIKDTNQCSDTAYGQVTIKPVYTLTIPNAFTPGSNGSNGGHADPSDVTNSVFFPITTDQYVDTYEFSVFNRWGELLFYTKDLHVGWDGYFKGKPCQQDVYVYKIKVRYVDGQIEVRTGDVTLLK